MPWTITKDHKSCPKSKPHAVVNKSTGRVAGCHRSKTKAQNQIAVLQRVANAVMRMIKHLVEAGRRARKAKDVDGLYAHMEKELRIGWRELAQDLRKQWKDPGIAHTFEARRGPSDKQMDALYNRAKKRADKRHVKAIDRNAAKGIERGGASALKDLQVGAQYGVSFDLKHPDAVKFLKQRGAAQVTNISETSRGRIKRLVVQMADEGKSYGEIGREIEKLVQGWSKRGVGAVASRGELIAVTEVGESYEAGRRVVMNDFKKAGLKVKKSWLTVGDERVCTICEPAEADGWIDSEREFSNGMDTPLGHPGCRCDLSLDAAA